MEQQHNNEPQPIETTSVAIAANPLLAVRCIHSHEDGLTKGKIYDAHKSNDWGFDIFPDDNGYLSGWNKQYFELVSGSFLSFRNILDEAKRIKKETTKFHFEISSFQYGAEWSRDRLIEEIERRKQLIISEPNGIVRETMIDNLLVDLQ